MSSQNVSGLMAGLSLYAPQSPRGSKSQQAGKTQESSHSSQSQNRLPPVLKKYMNPGLVRPPNSGLANNSHPSSSCSDTSRGPLLTLAGVNVSYPKSGALSPTSKFKGASGYHSAHGIHGPAHSTSSRAMASSINPGASKHSAVTSSAHITNSASENCKSLELGRYDGGLEEDEANHGDVSGPTAKMLELSSVK